jgi:peptidoglycan/LPS O-acetylase OafA/YrhL/lysophospholipase L1-like esterase
MAAIMGYHAELAWADGAFLSVSTFFTLSGFLITTLLVLERERTGAIDLKDFYVRRLRRLMPAALVALVGIAVIAWLFGTPSQQQGLRGDGLSALFYGANWRFIATGSDYADLFVEPSFVRHFWTLAIEEQFYLVFPLVTVGLMALGKGRRSVLLLGYGGIAVATTATMALLHQPGDPLIRFYYGTDARVAELLAGCVLAVLLTGRWPFRTSAARVAAGAMGTTALALTLVLWVLAQIDGDLWYEGGLFGYSLVTCAVIVACVTPGNPVRWLLAAWPLRELGRISYGTYLYHWPVFLVLDEERTGLPEYPLFVLRVAVTLGLAYLSFRFIETPVRKGTFRLPVRPAVAAATAIAVVAGALLVVTVDPPEPDLVLVQEERDAPPPPPPDRPPPTIPPTVPPTTGVPTAPGTAGTTASTVPPVPFPAPARVMVVGDSISWSLGNGVLDWGEQTGLAEVWNAGQIGCGVATGGEPVLHQNPCEDFRTLLPPVIAQFRPDVAVMMTGAWDLGDRTFPGREGPSSPGDPEFDQWMLDEYQQVVDVLTAEGAVVAWLTAPCIEETERAGPFAGTSVFEPERTEHLNDVVIPRLAAANTDRMRVIDVNAEICPDGQYAGDLYGVSGARPDGLHFSDEGGFATSEWLGPQILTWPPSPPPGS